MDSHIHPDYYKDGSVEKALSDTQATIDHIAALDPTNRLVTPILTPRFAPSCTAPLLSGLGALAAQTQLPVQTHISENTDELALVKELFPEHASYADVYDAHGLLTTKTVLAHACHLSAAEVALVKVRGASISHCPISNSYLGSGVCPVREFLDMGIPVGLGTDVSGGWSPSVLTAAREAAGVSRYRGALLGASVPSEKKDALKLTVEETLYLATKGGAKCLGLENKVGSFEIGMQWDAQFVDLGTRLGEQNGVEGGKGNVEIWEGMEWDEILAKWVFCGDERNSRAIWVDGRLVSGSMREDS